MQAISTRSVDDLVEATGIDSGLSKSKVSRICAGLDETVGAFRTRVLDHVEFPYVYLDATYVHVRNTTGQVFWRGLHDLAQAAWPGRREAVISDQHVDLVAALQRCAPTLPGHFARNLLAHVAKTGPP